MYRRRRTGRMKAGLVMCIFGLIIVFEALALGGNALCICAFISVMMGFIPMITTTIRETCRGIASEIATPVS